MNSSLYICANHLFLDCFLSLSLCRLCFKYMSYPQINAALYVPLLSVSLSFIVLALCLEWFSPKYRNSRNERITKHLMHAIIVLNLLMSIGWLQRYTVCLDCQISFLFAGNVRVAAKFVNYAFFVHRAKLAQGMAPLFGRHCFEKTLPIFVSLISLLFMGIATFMLLATDRDRPCVLC